MTTQDVLTPETREAIQARLSGLDRLLEHRVRLVTTLLLAPGRDLAFSELRRLTGETDGNLGAHLKRLAEAGYLVVDRSFVGERPLTRYRLTAQGLDALERHLEAFEGLLAIALD